MSEATQAGVDRMVSLFRSYQFRGKFRLLDPLVPHEGERLAAVFGYTIALDLGRKIQRDIYMQLRAP